MNLVKSLLVGLVLAPALAFAQPATKTADDWYKDGETQYTLGEWDKAADAFKQGFAAETEDAKKPAYLYNIGQAYRQAHKCKDAAFFYKRYRQMKVDENVGKPLSKEKLDDLESKIAEMDACAGGGTTTVTTTTTPKTNPTTVTTTTPKTNPTTTTTTTPPTRPILAPKATPPVTTVKAPPKVVAQVDTNVGSQDEGEDLETGVATQPQLVSARLLLGTSRVGAGDLDVGFRGSFALLGGYPIIKQEKLLVEAGLALAYTPVVYHNAITDADQMSSIFDVFANGAATYTVMPKISVRGDLGLGLQSWSGLKAGNPFTESMLGTTGALTTFALRVGVSGDYQITKNIVATATPFALTYSPAKSGMRSDISAVTQIQFMVGVGYRM